MVGRVGLVLLTLCLLVGAPLARREQERRQRNDCQRQLREYGTALEMYSTDFAGRYPVSAGSLVPGYLPELPRCPTNNSTYAVATASNPDLYTLICRGYHP